MRASSLEVGLIGTGDRDGDRDRLSACSPASTAGSTDTLLLRLTDVVLCFPVLLVGLGLGAACSVRGCFKGGNPARRLITIVAIVALFNWTYIMRIVRGQVLSLREREFVDAARSLGASNARIVFREILPNLTAPLIVYASLLTRPNILLEAALSFLGVGVRAPAASWGQMLADATPIFNTAWWYMLFPGLALLLTVLAFNLLGDGLQDALNPQYGPFRQVIIRGGDLESCSVTVSDGGRHRCRRPQAGVHFALGSSAFKLAGVLAVALAACGSGDTASSATSSIPLKAGESPVGQQLYGKQRGGSHRVRPRGLRTLRPRRGVCGRGLHDHLRHAALALRLPSQQRLQARTRCRRGSAGDHRRRQDGDDQIRPHIYFSPPVNREVNSGDVAYAIERGANPNVANAYFEPYFGDIVGAENAKGGPISGIETPSSHTIVFHLTKPTAALLVGALSLPLSAPVPPEFAKPLDAHKPTTYGSEYLVATGPYMLKSDSTGKFLGIGYQPGKSATLVRNPRWNPHTDFRPAYLNEIDINIGGEPPVIGKQVCTVKTPCRTTCRRSRSSRKPTSTPPADHLHTRLGHLLRLAQQRARTVHQHRSAQGGVGGDQP